LIWMNIVFCCGNATRLLRRTGAYHGKHSHLWGKLVCLCLLSVYELLECLGGSTGGLDTPMRQGHPRPTGPWHRFRYSAVWGDTHHPGLIIHTSSPPPHQPASSHTCKRSDISNEIRPPRHGPILSLSRNPSPDVRMILPAAISSSPFRSQVMALFAIVATLAVSRTANQQGKAGSGCMPFNQGSHVHVARQGFGAPPACTQGSANAPRIQSVGSSSSPAEVVAFSGWAFLE
jgi:hypothetical protein